MTLTKYERNNCIKTDISFKSNGVATDPSGSKAFVSVIQPNGNLYFNESRGSRTGVGEYEYYFTPSANTDLGVWVIVWSAHHSIGIVDNVDYGYKKITQREAIEIVHEYD